LATYNEKVEEMIKLEKNIFSYPLTTYRMGFSGISPLNAITCKTRLVGGGLVEGKYAKKFKKIFKKLSNLQTKGGLLS